MLRKGKTQITRMLSVLLLAGTLVSTVSAIPASAATKDYKASLSSYGNWGNDGNWASVQHITTYFSNSECKRIAQNYKNTGKVSTISAALAGKNPFVSAALVAYGYSMSEAGDLFQKVADRGTGIEISYDYYISNVSYSLNKADNVRVRYR